MAKATVFCFYCTSWLRCPALSVGPQHKMLLEFKQKNLCFSARLTKGRCAVVWILLICVKVIFKLFTMGARQRYLFRKQMGCGFLGPCSHQGFCQVQKTQSNPFSSQQMFFCITWKRQLCPSTPRDPSPTIMTLSHLGVTSLSEHLENLTMDPREPQCRQGSSPFPSLPGFSTGVMGRNWCFPPCFTLCISP